MMIKTIIKVVQDLTNSKCHFNNGYLFDYSSKVENPRVLRAVTQVILLVCRCSYCNVEGSSMDNKSKSAIAGTNHVLTLLTIIFY